MNKLNWQEGLKRLYYVLWAVAATISTAILISDGGSYPTFVSWVAFTFGPGVLMKCASWIYEGLVS